MLTGIKLARTEATKRNATVRFQMMTSTDDSCGLSASAANWVVSDNDAVGKCNLMDPMADPKIIRIKAQADGTANAVYAATQSTPSRSTHWDESRRSPVPISSSTVTNPTGGACVAASGPMRCLRIIVTPGGQARMCDPAVTDTNDSRKC